MEEKLSYHVVITTHNSRTSQRMIKYRVQKGPAINFSLQEEIRLMQIIKDIVHKYEIEMVSCNVCKDHLHFLLFCKKHELPDKVKTLKSLSSKNFSPGVTLWSQKYFSVCCITFNFYNNIIFTGLEWNTKHFKNAISYIQNNRNKHDLIDSIELKEIINSCIIKRG